MSSCTPESPCTAEARCDSCARDLALLTASGDPWRAIALPHGWTRRHDPIGHQGADVTLYDDEGEPAGSYGHVSSHRESSPHSYWLSGGQQHPTEADCVAAIIRRHLQLVGCPSCDGIGYHLPPWSNRPLDRVPCDYCDSSGLVTRKQCRAFTDFGGAA
jgi:hypothetical protein